MSGKVTITSSLGLKLNEVLFESEMRILEDLGEQSQALAWRQWTGWQYKNNYPKDHQGTSFRGWKFKLFQSSATGLIRGVELFNDATKKQRKGTKKNGQPYSSSGVGNTYARYVHRAGATVTAGSDKNREWVLVRDKIKKELIPQATKALRDEIVNNAGKNRVRRSYRADKKSSNAQTFDILTQTTF
tara:strand:- start:277 stop:837 length:561 start_codon:yes stop_codon:yes gene_type:complete